MNLVRVKQSLINWNDAKVYDVIKQYTSETDMDEKFVKLYLGEELYERLELVTRFVRQVESLKRSVC
jgi:hypothetical protein